MNIKRADTNDADIFCPQQLAYGACCFYTEDRLNQYFFEIKGQEAVLHTNPAISHFIDAAIDEFLFYSNFIHRVKAPNGHVLREQGLVDLCQIEINKIQPSQFYVSEAKLASCKKWIKAPEDIKIPITVLEGRIIALDGHTRLRAAADLGFGHVYTYVDYCGEYICQFVVEANKRGVFDVLGMEILSEGEYEQKWHKFCDEFFGRKGEEENG